LVGWGADGEGKGGNGLRASRDWFGRSRRRRRWSRVLERPCWEMGLRSERGGSRADEKLFQAEMEVICSQPKRTGEVRGRDEGTRCDGRLF